MINTIYKSSSTLITLIVITTLLNFIRVPFFYDFELVIAPFLVLTIAIYLGTIPALIVSLISSIPLCMHWHSFYPLLMLAAETLFVGVFYHKIRENLFLTIFIFWLFIGGPTTWIFLEYNEVIGGIQKDVFVLKRVINALLYTYIATLFMASGIASRILVNRKHFSRYTLRKKYTRQLSLIFIGMGLFISTYGLRHHATKALTEQRTNHNLIHANLKGEINALMLSRIASLKELAQVFSFVWESPSERSLQLQASHKRHPYYRTMILADTKGNLTDLSTNFGVIAKMDIKNANVADRDYFKFSIDSTTPYVSNGFGGRAIPHKLLSVISSRVMDRKNEKSLGIVQGAMLLEDFNNLKTLFDNSPSKSKFLLDQDNQLILSSHSQEMHDLEKINLMIADSVIHDQKMAQIVSESRQIDQSVYYFRQSTFDWGWKLITLEDEIKLARYNMKILLIFIMALISIVVLSELIATMISSFWTRQLRVITSAVEYIGLEKSAEYNLSLQDLPIELNILYKMIESSKREIALVKDKNNRLIHVNTQKLERINTKLRILESQDYLTKLLNLESFNKNLSKIWGNRKNSREILSIVVVSVDKLESINLKYRQSSGDEVLVKFAKYLSSEFDESIYCIGRLEGNKFGIISNLFSHYETLEYAEKIKSDISLKKFPTKFNNIVSILNITISVGVASCDAGSMTLKQFIALTDDALIKAKATGGNCVHSINKSIIV